MSALRPEVKKLKQAFEASDLSVIKWAEESGVSTSTIYQMLRGEKVPTTETYEALANALEMKIDLVEKGNGKQARVRP